MNFYAKLRAERRAARMFRAAQSRSAPSKRAAKAVGTGTGQKFLKVYPVIVTMVR